MDEETIMSLRVNELKQKLTELGLSRTGQKTTLQDRLLEHYNLQTREIESESEREFSDAIESRNELEYKNERPSTFTLTDIRESVSIFYGTGLPRIEQWLQEFEDNATVVKWTALQKYIYAKQLLKGAAQIWLRGQANINSWPKLKEKLGEEFGNKLSTREIHQLLEKSQKKPRETYLEFLYKIIEKAKPLCLDDESIIEYFIAGIPDLETNKTVLYEAKTIEELKNKIRTLEKIKLGESKTKFKNVSYKQNFIKKNQICEACPHLNNHTTEECRKINSTCFNCNKKGHKASECRGRKIPQTQQRNYLYNQQGNNNSSSPAIENRQNEITYPQTNSNIQHRQHQNNNIRNEHTGVNRNTDRRIPEGNYSGFHSKFCFTPIDIYKEITMNDVTFKILFDTGSNVSLITKSIYDKLKNRLIFPEKLKINGVGQGVVQTLGYIIARAKIDDVEFNWRFHIVNDEDIHYQPLLGSDVLKILNVQISQEKTMFTLKEEQQSLEDMLFEDMLGKVESDNQFSFTLRNEFGRLCENDWNEINISSSPANSKEYLIETLIKNYKPNKTRETNIETKIILTDDIPIRQKPRPLSYEEKKFVEKQTEEWLEKGIIKQSQSEYASPIVLVSKKDGTIRLCCDYRKINAKTVRDNFPMVLIDDILAQLQNAKIYTTLDLKNGYFHVPVERNSQKFTSFVTHNAQYDFLKTPFGITNAPATFCRFIAAIFHEYIQNGTVIIYMDDIVIPSQTIEENLEKLTKVLDLASSYGLEINFNKCQFVEKKILFLGYIIENSTIKPSEEKITAITKYKEPIDTKSLQRFLGMTSYFRRFIRSYAFIAKPLTELLKENKKFTLNYEERLAFEQLKTALTNSPLLKIFNPHADTEVHSDASMYGYGATLLQKDSEDMKWHPVEYMSRKTTPLEQKYHSYELEVLAIINSLKKWRCYLMGIRFKIVTDCHAFTQTISKKEVPARISRWILFLQEYDFEIEHRSCERLKHVDALSRVHSFLIQSSLKHSINEAQKEDKWTSAVRELLKNGKYQDFFMKYDILHKDPEKQLIVIPAAMEKNIIEITHKQGHISARKTAEIIQKDFYIPNITEKVTQITKNCIQCIVAGAKSGKKEGLLNPIDKSDVPLQTFHMDHVGPLETTKKQYNYILAIVDAFSKFIWLYPTKSTGTNEVVNILEKQATVFGNPSRIITDRGTAFTSQMFEEYCQTQNITHHLITTGVPRSNGQIERMHKIVISLLTKLVTENPQNWYRYINQIQQTLNSTPNRSTKTTPFKILTGVEMRINGLNEIKQLLTEEQIKELENNRNEIREYARENILRIQEENRSNYNKNRKSELDYQIGNLVAIKRTQFGSGLKIKQKYLGPYKVVKKRDLGRYTVEKVGESEGPRTTTTIAEYMKPWAE